MSIQLCLSHHFTKINTNFGAEVDRKKVLTAGHPLQWDLTFSSIIPTAASLTSTDLATPFTSFPAASKGPASVPTRVRVCLRGNPKWNLPLAQDGGSSTGTGMLTWTPPERQRIVGR